MTAVAEKLTIRRAAVAGMFYNGSPDGLRFDVDDFLDRAETQAVTGTVQALIVPHAGYMYSGYTAAHAYRLLKGAKYDCVVIIGPSHREYFDGISAYPGDAYETPLGRVRINTELRNDLAAGGKVAIADAGHHSEHSVEVQLPFLQRVLGEFSFIPLVMGDQQARRCFELSEALQKIAEHRNVLFVASSDLSHYHPYDEAVALDKRVLDAVKGFDPRAFIAKLEDGIFEACGGGPIAAVMDAAQRLGANSASILHYSNSGDITGDRSGVVGYLSAAFSRVAA
jgi:AmmeMemoRadiSam system protein B